MHYILAALKITTGTMKMVSNITTHHILDSSTREEPIKEAIPVPEDVGEDQVPEGNKLIMENPGGKNKVPGSGYLAFDLKNHKRPR